jgi:hypothetical protein
MVNVEALIANSWGEAKQKALPFFYTQHQIPLKKCGHIVKLYRADDAREPQCAICIMKRLPQGIGC